MQCPLDPEYGPILRAYFYQLSQSPSSCFSSWFRYLLGQPPLLTPKQLTCLGPELFSLTSSEMCLLDATQSSSLLDVSSPSSTPPLRPISLSHSYRRFFTISFFKRPWPYPFSSFALYGKPPYTKQYYHTMAHRLTCWHHRSPLHLCPAAGQLLFFILPLTSSEKELTTENDLWSLKLRR